MPPLPLQDGRIAGAHRAHDLYDKVQAASVARLWSLILLVCPIFGLIPAMNGHELGVVHIAGLLPCLIRDAGTSMFGQEP